MPRPVFYRAPNLRRPKSDAAASPRRRLWCWWLSGAGACSAIWFLVRVIPKPSRAFYPCQRLAFPAASGFVIWLLSWIGAAVAWRKARAARLALGRAFLWLVVALGAIFVVVWSTPTTRVAAGPAPTHAPLGTAKGIFPGRVVWVHAPDATSWAGYSSPEHWWQTNHTDLAVVEEMVAQALRTVTGAKTDAKAWEALFRYFNEQHGQGSRGYQAGEKVAIKINLTTCNARSGSSTVDPATYEKQPSIMNTIDNSPQMILALLRQLVYQAGVVPSDIAIGDPTGQFPKYLYDAVHPEFPEVIYFDNKGTAGSGRTRAEFSTTKFDWSTAAAAGRLQDYVPTQFAEATYLINFPVLKGHSAGVTVCGKNHYGSLLRCPDGYLRGAGTLNYYSMHDTLPGSGGSTNLGAYRALVDLMGHPALGGKTLLYLVDGLYGGYYWDSHPYRWNTAPFNGDWPSSLFVSLDPVAMDSVCYDFLRNEWPDVVTGAGGNLGEGPQDYLHEAALADNPPSRTFYDPGRTGQHLASLGVHEHWNNPTDKQYSRNLGTGQGIELVALTATRPDPLLAIRQIGTQAEVSWQGSLTGFRLQRRPDLAPAGGWLEVGTTPLLLRGRNTVTEALSASNAFYRLIQ